MFSQIVFRVDNKLTAFQALENLWRGQGVVDEGRREAAAAAEREMKAAMVRKMMMMMMMKKHW